MMIQTPVAAAVELYHKTKEVIASKAALPLFSKCAKIPNSSIIPLSDKPVKSETKFQIRPHLY